MLTKIPGLTAAPIMPHKIAEIARRAGPTAARKDEPYDGQNDRPMAATRPAVSATE
jgi:hypothetical protein